MGFLSGLFGKKKPEESFGLTSELRVQAEHFELKSDGLNDSFAEEKKLVKSICEDIKNLVPVDDLNGRKFEQDIMFKLSAANSLCDSAISGRDQGEFSKSLAALDTSVKQRKLFK